MTLECTWHAFTMSPLALKPSNDLLGLFLSWCIALNVAVLGVLGMLATADQQSAPLHVTLLVTLPKCLPTALHIGQKVPACQLPHNFQNLDTTHALYNHLLHHTSSQLVSCRHAACGHSNEDAAASSSLV